MSASPVTWDSFNVDSASASPSPPPGTGDYVHVAVPPFPGQAGSVPQSPLTAQPQPQPQPQAQAQVMPPAPGSHINYGPPAGVGGFGGGGWGTPGYTGTTSTPSYLQHPAAAGGGYPPQMQALMAPNAANYGYGHNYPPQASAMPANSNGQLYGNGNYGNGNNGNDVSMNAPTVIRPPSAAESDEKRQAVTEQARDIEAARMKTYLQLRVRQSLKLAHHHY
jgi:hypothetical protein